jgi:inner membrane protein
MDNITHSLVGALTAESALAFLKIKSPDQEVSRRTRISFWLSALIANNFCDIDFVISLFLKPTHLQYLLHHRGHTHTFILAPLEAALIFLGFWGWGKIRKVSWEKRELWGMGFLSFLGIILHLLLDSLNQYGIHPFWPFYNGWIYADMMFIVEPWLWVTLLPLLFFASHNKYLRAFLGSVFIAGLGLIWFSGFIPWAIALAVTLWSAILFLLFMYYGNHTRLAICYSAISLICLTFSLESHWVKKEIRERFEAEQPGVLVNDVILSPFPSNPVCWYVVTVETLPTRINIKLRRGVVTLFSNLYSPEDCLHLVSKKENFSKTHPQVIWTTEIKLPLEELKRLSKENCVAAAQLKFLRAPFWYRQEGKLYLADLRFETGTRGNFSKMEVPPHPSHCPRFVPPWLEPRSDLLND